LRDSWSLWFNRRRVVPRKRLATMEILVWKRLFLSENSPGRQIITTHTLSFLFAQRHRFETPQTRQQNPSRVLDLPLVAAISTSAMRILLRVSLGTAACKLRPGPAPATKPFDRLLGSTRCWRLGSPYTIFASLCRHLSFCSRLWRPQLQQRCTSELVDKAFGKLIK